MHTDIEQELYTLCSKYCGRLMQSTTAVSKAELLRRLKVWVPLIISIPVSQEQAVAKKLEDFVDRAALTPSQHS